MNTENLLKHVYCLQEYDKLVIKLSGNYVAKLSYMVM